MNSMEKGTLVRWNAEKGFGFIKPDATNNQDVFIHISALKQMARKPLLATKSTISQSNRVTARSRQ
ncbi:hypothetical protein TUM3794_11330 [Shewanella colwelliana]|uniref:CSD domain-containing protein n=1 Tax=Shewanella colwelliana TaxID=23 RepID=A0ABQ4NWW6_SHECO|nr:hypothetical protein TUM3794_11330 [Shewanella colwelliana]